MGRNAYIYSIGTSHWVNEEGTRILITVGGASQERIISIKRHLDSLIFEITSPLVDSSYPDKYSYEISEPKFLYI